MQQYFTCKGPLVLRTGTPPLARNLSGTLLSCPNKQTLNPAPSWATLRHTQRPRAPPARSARRGPPPACTLPSGGPGDTGVDKRSGSMGSRVRSTGRANSHGAEAVLEGVWHDGAHLDGVSDPLPDGHGPLLLGQWRLVRERHLGGTRARSMGQTPLEATAPDKLGWFYITTT